MVDFLVEYYDVIISFAAGAYLYAYKKGKEETTKEAKARNTSTNVKQTQKDIDDLSKEHYELKKIVSRIEEALDRTYATTKYVHDTFPSREVFDIKMEAVQEHITQKIDAVLELMKMQREHKH